MHEKLDGQLSAMYKMFSNVGGGKVLQASFKAYVQVRAVSGPTAMC